MPPFKKTNFQFMLFCGLPDPIFYRDLAL